MPEFKLNCGTAAVHDRYKECSYFMQGYIEAMFFTSTANEDGLEDADVSDLAEEAWKEIERDCIMFQSQAASLLDRAYSLDGYDEGQAGRDFWFTRNQHGVGFWDRKALPGRLGEYLTGYAHNFSEVDLYRGDDGLLYLS